eukprot:647913-Amphidinium_carterae.1
MECIEWIVNDAWHCLCFYRINDAWQCLCISLINDAGYSSQEQTEHRPLLAQPPQSESVPFLVSTKFTQLLYERLFGGWARRPFQWRRPT